MKAALKSSMESEEKSVIDRFAKAESIIAKTERKTEKQPTVDRELPIHAKHEKVLRDTYTIPENDYNLIKEIKLRCMRAGIDVSKSELIRAGIKLLYEATDDRLFDAINKLDRLKVGRKPFKDTLD